MDKIYKRICEKCGQEMIYSSASSFYNARKKNSTCRSCSAKEIADQKRNGDLSKLLEESYEAYYWIGFILADGSIEDNRLKITLAIKDKEHLEKFAKFINYDGEVVVTSKNQVYIGCKNVEIIPLLCKKFNILSNKTYNPPETISKFDLDLQYCLLAGFIDGDGCIQNQSNGRKDFSLRIKNHSSWEHILKEFNQLIDNSDKFVRVKNSGYVELIISNTEILKSFKRKIETYNLPLMSRKWEIINYDYESKLIGAELLKENVLKDLALGMTTKDISIKHNTSLQNIYRIKRNYYEQK